MTKIGQVVYVYGYNVIGTVQDKEGEVFTINRYGQEPLYLTEDLFRPAQVEDFEWAGWYADEGGEDDWREPLEIPDREGWDGH